MLDDPTVPSEIAFVKGTKGGLRVVFNNSEGKKVSEVLVSAALKDQVISVLTALHHSTLIGNTAKESMGNLKNLLSKMGDAVFNKTFPLLKPQPMKCCCAHGCTQNIPGSLNRKYCSMYHNKLEFIHQKVEEAKSTDMFFQKCLASMVLEESLAKMAKKANPLQPALELAKSATQGCTIPTFKTNTQFLRFYWKYVDILLAPLGVPVNPQEISAKVVDQLRRARCLANLLRTCHKVVRLMDGHCGFLLMFMAEVHDRYGSKYLNSLKFELVDIDDTVTQWHKHMYRCTTLECLTENIVDRKNPLPDSTLLYLNFCGVSKSFEDVRAYLKEHPIQCMLSFSMARGASNKDYEKSLISLKNRFLKKLPSQRNNFVTYVVALSAHGAQAVNV